jgi:hypothetical protein
MFDLQDVRQLYCLLVATEGFFEFRILIFSPGSWVAVVIWRFWQGKVGRGPGQEARPLSGCSLPDGPPPDPSPSGRTASVTACEGLRAGTDAVFFFHFLRHNS